MRQVVTCHCGAKYERTETLLIFWVADDFFCRDCGEVLELWNGSRIPVYTLRRGREQFRACSLQERSR